MPTIATVHVNGSPRSAARPVRPLVQHLSPLAARGGCEVNCLRVIEGLPDCDHRVLVFDEPGPLSAQWEAAGARVEHLAAWRSGRPAFRRALAAWSDDLTAPDGVFCWSTSRLPSVLGLQAQWNTRWCVYLGNPVPRGLRTAAERWTRDLAGPAPAGVTLVACSNHVAASHRRAAYFRRFPTAVIRNAVAPDFDRPRVHRPLGPDAAPRLGMVARLDAIKDHATLLRAVAGIAPARPDLTLDLAGDGGLRPPLEMLARQLGLTREVRFLGSTEVAPLLAAWDVYIHSTTSAEGMGTAVAEAMMAGLPCLLSDLAVMREVGGDAVGYFPPGDPTALGQAVLALLADPARREAMGRAAQRRARLLFGRADVAAAYRRTVLPAATEVAP